MASAFCATLCTAEGVGLVGTQVSFLPAQHDHLANHAGRDRMPILPPAIEIKDRIKK